MAELNNRMARLVIFGDSFVYDSGVEYLWVKQVADHYNMQLVNLAEEGSSFHHSQVRMMEYLAGPLYTKDDWFIFLVTSLRRSQWADPPASASMIGYFTGKLKPGIRGYDYYKEREHFYTQYLNMYRPDMETYQQLGLISLLHTLPNPTLLLTGWPLLQEISKKHRDAVLNVYGDKLLNSSSTTIMVRQSLYDVSMNEMSLAHKQKCQNEGWSDTRRNHFCEPNHGILAQCAIDSFDSWSDCFDKELFHKNIFNPFT